MADSMPHGDDSSSLSFARGGPIYVPDLVGPITSVPEFIAAAIPELESLEAKVHDADVVDFDDELSLEELKVWTEEELVEIALKEVFEDDENGKNKVPLLQYPSESIDGLQDINKEAPSNEDTTKENCDSSFTAVLNDSPNSPLESGSNQQQGEVNHMNLKKRKKRGRVFDRDLRGAELENSAAKVERIAKMKQNQEDNKAAARLHSFKGSATHDEATTVASNKTERMRALRFMTLPMKVKSSNTNKYVPVSYPEVVLSVEIYKKRTFLKKVQEFLVLGRQTLAELRDDIYCLTDELMQKAGQHDPSGYFLIEDFFCNDLRDPSSIDYSQPILDWLQNCKSKAQEKWDYLMSGELKKQQKELLGSSSVSNFPQLKAFNMERTRFCDLKFRLGAGYLYCHQGDCKHIMVIRDMRLIHPEDNQNMAAYPILTFQIKLRYRKCSVCEIYRATKVTVDDKWATQNPCYFCEICYHLLHYDKDGALLYNEFTVHDYFHE